MNAYLEQEILSSPVPVTVADIFGNGNNLDETHVSRQQLPRRPPRTPRSRRIACPIVPDNPESKGMISDKIRIKILSAPFLPEHLRSRSKQPK